MKKKPITRRARGRRRPDEAAPAGYISKRELLAQRDQLVQRATALIEAAQDRGGDDALVAAAESVVTAAAAHAGQLPPAVVASVLRLAGVVGAAA